MADTTYMPTMYGYAIAVQGGNGLPPLITPDDFAAQSQGRFSAADLRVIEALNGVSSAIRSYCHWHVTPALDCEIVTHGDGGRIISLPTLYLSAIGSVVEDGIELTSGQYEARSNGLIRRTGWKIWSTTWNAVTIDYNAGFPAEAVPEFRQIVLQIAGSAVSAALGVREEHAGQVGVTYNQTASGVSGGISLLDRDKDMLAPFRISNI